MSYDTRSLGAVSNRYLLYRAFRGMERHVFGDGHGPWISNRNNDRNDLSFTQTETSNSMELDQDNQIGTIGASRMSVSTGFKVPKNILRSSKIQYHDTYTTGVGTNSNIMAMSEVSWIGVRDQWLNPSPSTVDNRDTASYASFFALNPLQGLPAGQIIAAQAGPGTDRMILFGTTFFLDMINSLNLGCYVTVYAITPKNPSVESISQEIGLAATNNKVYNTDFSQKAATVLDTVTGNYGVTFTARSAGASQHNRITCPTYSNPMSNPGVMKNYKILGFKKIILAPGDNHRLTIFAKQNQYAMKEVMLDETTVNFVPGAIGIVIEVQGSMVKDTGTNGTYNIGNAQIQCQITRKCKFGVCKSPNSRFFTKYYGQTEMTANAPLAANNTLLQGAVSAVAGTFL